MRTQTIFQLLIHISDFIRDICRFAVIVFQYLIYGFLSINLFIVKTACLLITQHRRSDVKQGVVHGFLVRQFTLSDLFFKPSHKPPPLSHS